MSSVQGIRNGTTLIRITLFVRWEVLFVRWGRSLKPQWIQRCIEPQSHRSGPQQRDRFAAEQFVRLRHLVDRGAPIQHRQKMSRANGAALLDDAGRNLFWCPGDELIIAD